MKFFAVTFFGLAAAFSLDFSSGPLKMRTMDEDLEMEILMNLYCKLINYEILSADNPTDYPSMGPSFGEDTDFVQDGENCNGGGMSVPDCDCNDAENYWFADQDVCNILEVDPDSDEEITPTMQQGMDTFGSLVCGGNDDEEWFENEWSEHEWPEDEWSEDDHMEEDMEDEKNCRMINYAILSDANPKDYPAVSAEFGDPSNFVQDDTNCDAGGMSVADCDCSDAENYNFFNQELCDELKLETESELYQMLVPPSMRKGMDKLKSLVCGSDVNSVSMILFAMLAMLKY